MMKQKNIFTLMLLAAALPLSAMAAPYTFTYQGTLTDSNDTVMSSVTETVTFSVYNPALSCLLYQESQLVTTDANGAFSAQIGSVTGSGKRTGSDPGLAMTKVFEGQTGAVVRSAGSNCSSGYSVAAGDVRYLRIKVGSTDLSPDLAISAVPFATTAGNSSTVGGFDSAYLFRSSATTVTDLPASSVTNLLYLAAPTSCTSGQFAKWDGTTWSCGNEGGTGTVTSVSAGSGLTVTNATTTPTVSLNLTASDIPNLSWSKITSGTPTSLSGYGITDAILNAGNTPSIQSGSDSSKPSASTVGRLYVATDTSKIYRDNGATWDTVASDGGSSGITSLVGEVTASGIGSVGATVVSVGGVTAANIASGVNSANAATSANTASTIVKRDAGGDFQAGDIAVLSLALKGFTSGTFTQNIPATTSTYSITWPSSAPSNGQTLTSDSSGNLSWSTPSGGGTVTNSASLTNGKIWIGDGSGKAQEQVLSGDATVTNAGFVMVQKIQGTSVSATAPSSSGQVLRYNGTNWSPSMLSMFDLRSTVTGTVAFGGVGCLLNQTLTWTAATDNLSCTDISLPSSQLTTGTGAVTLGTSNGNDVNIKTNNTARMTVLANGNVGVGISSPARLLHVQGPIRLTPGSSPSSPAAGDMYFDSGASNTLKYHNGSTWISLGAASGDFMKDGSIPMTGSLQMAGNTINGSASTNGNLTLDSTSHVSKGQVRINPSGGYVGIGTNYAWAPIHIVGDGATGVEIDIDGFNTAGSGNSANLILKNTNSTTNNGSGILAQNANGGYSAGIEFGHANHGSIGSSSGYIVFQTSNSGALTESARFLPNGSLGIGTTYAYSRLSVNGGIQMNYDPATCTSQKQGTLRYNGGLLELCNGSSWVFAGGSTGGVPTLSSCSGGSLSGNDMRGKVTFSSTSAASCTILFGTSYSAAPVCVVSHSASQSVSYPIYVAATTTNSVTINLSSGSFGSGASFSYICMQ